MTMFICKIIFSGFVIDPATGEIRLDTVLDRESTDLYQLTVSATDGGSPVPLTSTAKVIVKVLDVNDVTPSFDTSLVEISLSEDAHLGHVAHTFKV